MPLSTFTVPVRQISMAGQARQGGGLSMSAVRAEALLPLISNETIRQLDSAAERLDRDQLMWASGYLAGLAAVRASTSAAAAPQAQPQPAAPWLILYATETGNSRRIAQSVDERLRAT